MNRSGTFIKPAIWTMALLAAAVVAGCGGGGDGGSAPAKPAAAPTGACSGGTSCVALGTAANYAILAQSGVSTVPTSAVTGNVGLSPAAATALTGFSQTLDASGTFSTSTQVTGKLFAADYTAPTPATLTTAVGDASTAYTDAGSKVTGFPVNPTAGVIPAVGSPPVAPGVYNWTGNVVITSNTELNGGPNDVWVFQIGSGNLSQTAGTTVTLAGGAQSKNVFWQVSGSVLLLTGAHLEGTVLAQTDITLQTGASVNGRLISGTAVSLDNGTVVQP